LIKNPNNGKNDFWSDLNDFVTAKRQVFQ
jgi:hypothetical protein